MKDIREKPFHMSACYFVVKYRIKCLKLIKGLKHHIKIEMVKFVSKLTFICYGCLQWVPSAKP